MPPNPNELVIATRASGERAAASRTKSARSGGEDAGFSAVFVTVFVIVIVSSFIVSSSRDASRVRKCSVGGVSGVEQRERGAPPQNEARRAEQMAYCALRGTHRHLALREPGSKNVKQRVTLRLVTSARPGGVRVDVVYFVRFDAGVRQRRASARAAPAPDEGGCVT